MDTWDNTERRYRQSEEAIANQEFDCAIRLLSELIGENPNEPLFHWRLGYVLLDLKDLQGAMAQFKHTIRLDPNSFPGWGGLGQVYIQLGNWDDAEAALNKRIAIKPSAPSFVFLAKVLYAKNDVEGAIHSCKKAVDLAPEFAEAYYNLGVYSHLAERADEAKEAFAKAIELDNTAYAEKVKNILFP